MKCFTKHYLQVSVKCFSKLCIQVSVRSGGQVLSSSNEQVNVCYL